MYRDCSGLTCDLQKHEWVDHGQDADQILDEEGAGRVDRVRPQGAGVEQCEVCVRRGNLVTQK